MSLPRIALVEDNADNRLLVETLLEDLYQMVEFATGREAVDGLLEADPALVLLDISLPGMDGTEVLAWIREQPPLADRPVVALTAHAMAGDRERYLALGFDDYITKPIVEEEVLLGTIARWLGSPE